MNLPLALLNTSIITTEGEYTLRTIDQASAIELIRDSSAIDSAIGHESTAQIMTTLLGVDVSVNRQVFAQKTGQQALVFKLNGRAPEGKILTTDEIESIGYKWQVLTRVG